MRRVGIAVVAVLVVAGGAHAAIVPQQGIGGARLGMTQNAVQATLGAPSAVRRGSNDIGFYVTFTYPSLQVTFFGGPTATSIVTRSPKQRTAGGVGVGSTAAEIAAAVPGVKCVEESGYRHCFVGTWRPGRKVSDFSIAHGRITRVTVGYVLD